VSGDAGRVERFVVIWTLTSCGRSAGLHKLASCQPGSRAAPSAAPVEGPTLQESA